MSKLIDCLRLFYGTLEKVVIHYDGGLSCECQKDISPRKFLYFAKVDNALDSEHHLVNSLTNAKRAIDCQVDCTLEAFGVTKLSKNKELEAFVNDFVDKEQDTAYKLKIIQALGIAPSKLVSEIRMIRHKLEHEYKVPQKQEVSIALDTAELFVIANDSKTSLIECYLKFVANENDLYTRGVNLNFNVENKTFSISIQDKGLPYEEYVINNTEMEYYYLLRLINTVKDEFEVRRTLKKLLERNSVEKVQNDFVVEVI